MTIEADYLIRYASNRNLAQVQRHLSMGIGVNSKDQFQCTALIAAGQCNHVDIVRELLAMNADVDSADIYGNTALLGATYKGNVDVVKALIDGKADVNKRNRSEETALIIACTFNDDADITKLLLDASTNVDAQDEVGMTALMFACKNERVVQARLLLKYGAGVSIKCHRGRTALEYATNQGNQGIIQALKDVSNSNSTPAPLFHIE